MSRLESSLFFRAYWQQCFFSRGRSPLAWRMFMYYHDKAIALMQK